MGERAALLEDAVARLADNRLRGEVMLRLNEAEFLLLLGEERLRLFGDVPAAIQAYNLSEAALASLDDPVLATLRQTLAHRRRAVGMGIRVLCDLLELLILILDFIAWHGGFSSCSYVHCL